MLDEVKFHLGIKAIIRNEKGQILLLKISNEEVPDHRGSPYWDIPGGRVQWSSVVRDKDTDQILWDETVRNTLVREVQEETGLIGIEAIKPFAFVISNISYSVAAGEIVGLMLRAYICEILQVGNISLSQEHTEHGWFSPGEAAALLSVKYPSDFCEAIPALGILS
jgi:8-oxo-dGTP pyrophosphatase MutT (NUDIX family)